MRWAATARLVWFVMALAWLPPCPAQDLRYVREQAWSTEEGLPQNSVHAIAQTSDGYLWIATEGGLARFDGFGFRVYGKANTPAFTSDDLCCLKVDGKGLLVGTADGTVREAGGRFTRSAGAVPESAPAAGWNWSGAVVRIDGREWRVGKELPGRVQAMLVDRQGQAWVGMRNGLAIIRPGSDAAVEVPELKGNSVLSLFEDAEGNHWVGTETTGLHVLRRVKFRTEPGLADLAVTSVVQASDGAMWVGTRDDGVRRVRNGVVDEPVPAGILTSPVVLSLAEDARGGVWVGTPDGLNHVDARSGVRKISSADGLPDDYVRSLAEGDAGTVWVGTQHGLAWVKDVQVKTFTAADGLGGDVVGALLAEPGRIWAATSGGLSMRVGEGSFRNFTAKDGLVGEFVSAMAGDGKGGFWVATKGGGLSRFDGARFVATAAVPKDAVVDGITLDAGGSLWLRLDRGIRRIADGAVDGRGPGRYGMADGLPTDEVVTGESSGGWLARDGEMWFPTRRGVAVVDTAHLPVDAVPPPVAVERFLVDDAEAPAGVDIPYGGHRITVEYAGLSFTAPSEVRYRVRLVGFDGDWVEAGSRRSATYTNLPPGHYTFRVQAVNGDGVWNEAGATLGFHVVPPFYRRWWFIALMLAALLLMLAGLYLLRLRRLRREFDAVLAERNRMAREIHDTLTQDFVGTSLQLDIVTQMLRKGRTEAAMEQVARTRRLVTEGLDEARQSIWELRANGSQDMLPARLTRLAQRESFAEIGAKVHCGGAYRVLEPRVEREILRVAQEALANVKKHAQATEVSVDLHYSDEAVVLTIADNGVGFATAEAQKTGHFGLVGMKERAAVADGELEVASEVGQGTVVKLTCRV